MKNRYMSFVAMVAVVFCTTSVFAVADYSFEVVTKWRARRLLRTRHTGLSRYDWRNRLDALHEI